MKDLKESEYLLHKYSNDELIEIANGNIIIKKREGKQSKD